ncbi:uncharacterized protein LOC130778476 isoform X4 [Actinidia eriantha]|uniref:uncharacterized protein LOC130778476 isoform X4 n=1 Tax=Actinidia eriantha TaxID=165200 RepID=UPI0025877508|nr:uncharacterized protein LOC130778476 isoform X4 [Actinidia eriantha]
MIEKTGMDREGGSVGSCYYAVIGICKDASSSDIRTAYRKLALKWHPDRWAKNSAVAGEANRRFQKIQEAYSGNGRFYVRSNEGDGPPQSDGGGTRRHCNYLLTLIELGYAPLSNCYFILSSGEVSVPEFDRDAIIGGDPKACQRDRR